MSIDKSVTVEQFSFRSRDGLTLVGDRAGDRGSPAVLLLHGGGQTRHSWGSAQRELAGRGYYVLNLDARGHGDSQWAASAAQYAFELLAADVQSVCDMLPKAPALVGASMGGLAAMTAIGADPTLGSAIVLVDVVPRIQQSGAERILRFMRASPEGFASVEEAAAAIAAYNPLRPAPKSLKGLSKNLRSMPSGRLRWHWDPQIVADSARGRYDPDRMLQNCRRYTRPAMLVRGMHSDVVSDAGVAELQSNLPQLEVVNVAAGHMLAGDKNDPFNQAMIEFLGKHLPV